MTIVPVDFGRSERGRSVVVLRRCVSDDYRFLGVPEGELRSSWEHCSDIVTSAEAQGFRNILCPSSYQVGQDTAQLCRRRIAGDGPDQNMLAAIRCGEMQPIMLARTVATLDHMLKGRLDVECHQLGFSGRGG